MVTLLLTFFVMLISLATVQDPERVGKGRDSFVREIKMLGLGMLSGRKYKPDSGKVKIKYFISESDESFKGRTINAREEEIRQIFQKISSAAKTMSSQIVAKKTNFAITNIRFSPGDATLNEPAKKFLTEFSLDLQQETNSNAIRLYVLGLAGDQAGEKEQWILSARRAQATAEFLQNTLSSGSKWPIYSWGAGAGGDWVAQDSPISRQLQILIAVLRTGE
jgi:outer membrane protein OmpA-like peptidoglycan-associated protein